VSFAMKETGLDRAARDLLVVAGAHLRERLGAMRRVPPPDATVIGMERGDRHRGAPEVAG